MWVLVAIAAFAAIPVGWIYLLRAVPRVRRGGEAITHGEMRWLALAPSTMFVASAAWLIAEPDWVVLALAALMGVLAFRAWWRVLRHYPK